MGEIYYSLFFKEKKNVFLLEIKLTNMKWSTIIKSILNGV